jgi:hypothetical protein
LCHGFFFVSYNTFIILAMINKKRFRFIQVGAQKVKYKLSQTNDSSTVTIHDGCELHKIPFENFISDLNIESTPYNNGNYSIRFQEKSKNKKGINRSEIPYQIKDYYKKVILGVDEEIEFETMTLV